MKSPPPVFEEIYVLTLVIRYEDFLFMVTRDYTVKPSYQFIFPNWGSSAFGNFSSFGIRS